MTCTLLFFTPAVVPVTFADTTHVAPDGRLASDRLTADEPVTAVAVAPQVLLRPLGAATARPAGKLSVKPTPFKVKVLFGLLMLNVSDVVPLSGIVEAPNVLAITGGLATVKFAIAVLPIPPSVELTLPETLVYCPDAVPVTFTVAVHVPPAAMLPPLSEIFPDPATAVAVPLQVLTKPFGVATTMPAGSASANATPVSATAFATGLAMVKVNEVVPFNGIVDAPKALAMEGGATTLSVAVLLVAPVPPSVEVTLLVVLFCVPAATPTMFTEKLQDAPAAKLAPARLTTLVPCVAVTVPLQEPARPFGVAITRPVGMLSLKPMPLRLVPGLVFVSMKVSDVVPFNGTLDAPNALPSVGGPTTVICTVSVSTRAPPVPVLPLSLVEKVSVSTPPNPAVLV